GDTSMTFTGNVTLGGASQLTVLNSTTFTGPWTGSQTLQLLGTGTVTLTGPSINNASAVTINMLNATFAGYRGTAVLANNNALGPCTLTLTGGNTQSVSGLILPNSLAISANANIAFTGTGNVIFNGAAATTASGTNLFTNTQTGGTVTINSAIGAGV